MWLFSWQNGERTVARSPSGDRAGTAEVINRFPLQTTYTNLGKRWYQNMVLVFPALRFGTRLHL